MTQRNRLCPTLLLGFALAAMPVATAAQEQTRLKRLTLRQETLGWESVGRLDVDLNGGFCSGALIAPDLVLTAAHCLIDQRGGRRNPADIRFRGALTDGVALVERRGKRAVVHPGYRFDDPDGLRQLQADVALLQLDRPIPAAEAPPFAIGRPVGEGARVSVVSYARDRADALAWQRACSVTGHGLGVLMMNCDTHFGSSGAPVFEMSSGRPRIVSVISRGRRRDGQVQVFGAEISQPLAIVKQAFRAGRGVWPEDDGFAARRTKVGDRVSGTAFKRAPSGTMQLSGGAGRPSTARFERVTDEVAPPTEVPANMPRLLDPLPARPAAPKQPELAAKTIRVAPEQPAPAEPLAPPKKTFWDRVLSFF